MPIIDHGKFHAVLFDLDGTLIDAFPPIISALNRTLKEFGRKEMSAEAIKRHTGYGGAGIKPLFPEHEQEAGRRFLELHDAIYLDQVMPAVGAERILNWLLELSIPMAVVTSKGEQRAKAQISHLGWERYFRSIIGRVDGRAEKPSPVPVRLACKALSVEPVQSLLIGDGIGDMKAGSSAGSYTIGIADSFSAKELKEAGANLCFDSLDEVLNWMKEKTG